MLDTGLWLFTGLVFLFIWRAVCWWTRCGCVTRHFNYMAILLMLVVVILAYDTYELCTTFSISNTETIPMWLKVMAYGSFPTMWITFIISAVQVFTHVEMINEESAVLRHDRAIQIIALPSVYGSMMLSCMTKCFVFLMTNEKNADFYKQLPLVVAEAETCTWIGDLYEAWALYEFGLLTLELMETSLIKQSRSQDQEARAAANGLLIAHKAVSRLAWLGILSFVLVSVADSAVALWYLTFETSSNGLVNKFNNAEDEFNVAGFLASCAAIYNVYVVEDQFHHFLEEFRPFLKFLTVKILVTFAYGQLYFFLGLRGVVGMLPPAVGHFFAGIPGLNWLIQCNKAQFYVFYCALLIYECFGIAVAHVWAWGAREHWYDADEEKPFLKGEAILYGTSEA